MIGLFWIVLTVFRLVAECCDPSWAVARYTSFQLSFLKLKVEVMGGKFLRLKNWVALGLGETEGIGRGWIIGHSKMQYCAYLLYLQQSLPPLEPNS